MDSGTGGIKLEMLTSLNMGLKERTKEKVRTINSTGAFKRRVGITFIRRFIIFFIV